MTTTSVSSGLSRILRRAFSINRGCFVFGMFWNNDIYPGEQDADILIFFVSNCLYQKNRSRLVSCFSMAYTCYLPSTRRTVSRTGPLAIFRPWVSKGVKGWHHGTEGTTDRRSICVPPVVPLWLCAVVFIGNPSCPCVPSCFGDARRGSKGGVGLLCTRSLRICERWRV